MADRASSPENISAVAIIGAGRAGRDFAAILLRAGIHVILEDVMPANLRCAQTDLATSPGRLTLANTVEDAVREADLAIDFVPDELESKLEIFSMVDRMAPPHTILCTPTEVLSITDLASCVYRPERCFALRGVPAALTTSSGVHLDLVYPLQAADVPLQTVRKFLSQIGFQTGSLLDPEAPVLVKNLR